MAKLIAIDDGHGSATPGKRTPFIKELGRQVKENEFNKRVAAYLDAELKRCGFRTLQLAPTDYDTPLTKRTSLANSAGADLLVSIHFNAFDADFSAPTPNGFSAHIYPGSSESRKVANQIIKHLAGGTKQTNRGIVEQNLHMTRESRMPAVLVEYGFMDYLPEALLMLNASFQKECARETAKGICDYFGVRYVPEVVVTPRPPSKTPEQIEKEEEVKRMQQNLKDTGFTDIPKDHRYARQIKRLKDKGILSGFPDGSFREEENLTRGQLAVVVDRLLDLME